MRRLCLVRARGSRVARTCWYHRWRWGFGWGCSVFLTCFTQNAHLSRHIHTHTHTHTGTLVIKEEAALRSFLAWNFRKFGNEDINININIGFPFEKFEQRLRLRKGKVAPRRCPFLGFSSFTFLPRQRARERERETARHISWEIV